MCCRERADFNTFCLEAKLYTIDLMRLIGMFAPALSAALGLLTSAAVMANPTAEIVASVGHADVINSVAYSPDGRFFLSGSNDRTVKLWEAASGRLVRQFEVPRYGVSSVAFSPDGSRILAGIAFIYRETQATTLRLWDAASGSVLLDFSSYHASVSSVAFSPDGKQILSGGGDNIVRLWDAQSGALVRSFEGHRDWVHSVAFSPDGKMVLSGSADKTVKLWDVNSGRLIKPLESFDDSVSSATFSPTGDRIAAISTGVIKREIRVWSVRSNASPVRIPLTQFALSFIAFSRDGSEIVGSGAGDDGSIAIWDASNGSLLRSFGAYSAKVNWAAVSPDGARLLASGVDRQSSGEGYAIKVFDIQTGTVVRSIRGQSSIEAIAVHGERLVAGGFDHSIKIWDLAKGELLRAISGHSGFVFSVSFSPDGTRLLSSGGDNSVRVRDIQTGQPVKTLEGHSSLVKSAAYSPDGRYIATGAIYFDNSIRLWDASNGSLLQVIGNADAKSLNSIAFSSDSTRIVSGGGDSTVKLWDAANKRLLRTFAGHSGAVNSVAITFDGKRIISGSQDRSIKVWDIESGQCILTLLGHNDDVTSIAVSHDDQFLASGSLDKTLRLWSLSSGELVRTFRGHEGYVDAVVYSADDRFLVSGSHDSTLKLWDTATGNVVRSFIGHTQPVLAVAISPDGQRIVSGGADNTLKQWDFGSGKLLSSIGGPTEPVFAVAFSADGSQVFSGGSRYSNADSRNIKQISIWNTSNGELERTIEGTPDSNFIRSFSFSTDQKKVAVGGSGKSLELWDVETGRSLQTFVGHTGDVFSVALSADGKQLLSGAGPEDNLLRLWDVRSGELIRSFDAHTRWIDSVAISPAGDNFISGGADGKVVVWNAATGQVRLKESGLGTVRSVAFSPDGSKFISGGSDKLIHMWETSTGNLLHTYSGHSGGVSSVAFSADSNRIIASGGDGSIKVWDADSAELLATFVSLTDSEWFAITPEGFFAASDNATNLISVVRGMEVYSPDQFFQALYRPDLLRLRLSGNFDDMLRVKLVAATLSLETVLDSGAPPDVSIASHSSVPSEEGAVRIDADISDRGGGIGRIEWRANGITLGVQTLQDVVPGIKRRISRTLHLGDGLNVVEVVAYNAKNLTASLPVATTISIASLPSRHRPRLFALAVGVDKYLDERLNLRLAGADASAIVRTLRDPAMWSQLYAESSPDDPVLDSRVTTEHLDRVFDQLGRRMRYNDVFVLYMAGHGLTDNGKYYFVPSNADDGSHQTLLKTSIDQDTIQEWLSRIPSLRTILIYDTCESGSATAPLNGFRGSQQLVAAQKLSRSMGRTVLAATMDDQPAKEGYDGHGFFTAALLRGLAQADENGNGFIEVSELATFISKTLPVFSKSRNYAPQIPQIRIIGSDFPLVSRADPK